MHRLPAVVFAAVLAALAPVWHASPTTASAVSAVGAAAATTDPTTDPTGTSPAGCVFAAEEFPVDLSEPCTAEGTLIQVTIDSDDVPDLGVPVPAPGIGADIAADSADGASYTLAVSSPVTGSPIAVLSQTTESEPTAASALSTASSPGKCSDYAYTFGRAPTGGKILVADSVEWYSYLASTPSRNDKSAVLADLKKAAAVISNTASPCDSRDLNPKPQYYRGDRSLAGGVNTTADCDEWAETDKINNVVFGKIDNLRWVALTCRWWDTAPTEIQGERAHQLRQADMRLNSNHYWATSGSKCTQSFSVAGVATHEFGHVWGMGHVAEATHGNLTMSENSNYCEFTQAQLGIGDVSGIGHLYNVLK